MLLKKVNRSNLGLSKTSTKLALSETDLEMRTKEVSELRLALSHKTDSLKATNQECMELRMNQQRWESQEKSMATRRREDQEKIVSLQEQLSEKMDECHTLHASNQEMEIELYQAKRQLEGSEKTIDIYKKEISVFKDLRGDYESRIQSLNMTVNQLAYSTIT